MKKVNANTEKKIRVKEFLLLFSVIAIFYSENIAQNSTVSPNYFYNSHLNLCQINPGAQITKNVFGTIQYQSSFGPLSKLNSVQGDFFLLFNKNQSIGLQVWNSNEGPFIQRNRLYGIYNIKVPLSKKVNLTSGVKLGLINHRFKASSSSPPSSGSGLDLGLGFELDVGDFKTGFTFSQIPDEEIVVLSEVVSLPTLFDFYSKYKIDLSPSVCFEPYVRTSYISEMNKTLLQLSANFYVLDEKVGGGFHFLWDEGFAPHVQVVFPISLKYKMKMGFTYFEPIFKDSRTTFSLSRYEISLQFFQE